MDLRIAIRSGCFGPGISLVLAKVMEVAKEIRPDDKKTCKDMCQDTYSPLRLVAGRLLADGLGGAVVCWRLLAFLGAEEARREGRAAGVMVCRGWLGGGDTAAICGGNSDVFNQLLTIFLVVAIVWRLSVFFLCSYRQFRRGWRLFRSPGAGRWWSVSGVVWGGWLLDQGMGGVAEKGTVLLRMGVEYCPTSSQPLHGLGCGGKQAGGLSAIRA